MSNLEITEINIHVTRKNQDGTANPLLAFVRIVLNDCFVVNGVKVIEGKFGKFISFPREYNRESKKANNICYPIRKDTHDAMASLILKEYEAALSQSAPEKVAGPA